MVTRDNLQSVRTLHDELYTLYESLALKLKHNQATFGLRRALLAAYCDYVKDPQRSPASSSIKNLARNGIALRRGVPAADTPGQTGKN